MSSFDSLFAIICITGFLRIFCLYACNAIIKSFLSTPLISGTPGEEPLTLWHVLQSLAKYSPYSGSPSKFRISADNSTSSECTKPENNPKINLIPPAKFFIYKNWMMLDSTEMANKFKEDIINNHPDSKYASILLDPNATINTDQNFELIYESIYQLYENEKYIEVISKCEENII